MKDKVIIITGASDGIGASAAKILKERGAEVAIVGRSSQKTKDVASKLNAPYYIADFSKFSDVRKLAAGLKSNYPKIDVLVNNAGGIMGKRELTIDGHEKTMQVNHYSPFLLTISLFDILKKSNTVVINTSSVASKLLSDFNINDVELEKNYTPNKAYGNAKLANILFTKELNKLYKKQGISAVAFHPGNVATNFSNNSTSLLRFLYRAPLKRFLLTSEKGADTLVWLAESQPNTDWIPGQYYEKRKLSKTIDSADDPQLAKRLWKISLAVTNGMAPKK